MFLKHMLKLTSSTDAPVTDSVCSCQVTTVSHRVQLNNLIVLSDRLVKKLEHSWKSLIHDGVSS